MLALLPDATRQGVANAYADAFFPLFLTAAGILAIAFSCAISLKNVQLPLARLKAAA